MDYSREDYKLYLRILKSMGKVAFIIGTTCFLILVIYTAHWLLKAGREVIIAFLVFYLIISVFIFISAIFNRCRDWKLCLKLGVLTLIIVQWLLMVWAFNLAAAKILLLLIIICSLINKFEQLVSRSYWNYQLALHEAGHFIQMESEHSKAVAYIELKDNDGFVAHNGITEVVTYEDALKKIRIKVSGLVAEELMYNGSSYAVRDFSDIDDTVEYIIDNNLYPEYKDKKWEDLSYEERDSLYRAIVWPELAKVREQLKSKYKLILRITNIFRFYEYIPGFYARFLAKICSIGLDHKH